MRYCPYMSCWVLAKILRALTHRADQRIPGCRIEDCQVTYNTENLTVNLMGNVFGECHAPCKLKISRVSD